MRRGGGVGGGGPSRRRQEGGRFLSAEDEGRLRANLDARRTRTEAEDMDVFDDAASDRSSVRNIVTHMEGRGRGQPMQQQQRTGRQDGSQASSQQGAGGQADQQQQRGTGGAGQWSDNEFDAGRRMMEIGDRLRNGIRDVVAEGGPSGPRLTSTAAPTRC